ncbi:MAG TPA: BrnT family toxin [Stellaceae bacterium]|nr:BrnT family toxin [Stellaceae bacterium]
MQSAQQPGDIGKTFRRSSFVLTNGSTQPNAKRDGRCRCRVRVGSCQPRQLPKHGVPIAAIEAAFRGTIAVFPDPAHSGGEERFKAVGRTGKGRYILIVFTLRTHDGETFIRPISARFMHLKEVEYYEETASRTAER